MKSDKYIVLPKKFLELVFAYVDEVKSEALVIIIKRNIKDLLSYT